MGVMSSNASHELLLLEERLSRIQNQENVLDQFMEALNKLMIGFHFSFQEEKKEPNDGCVLPIATIQNHFGYCLIQGDWQRLSNEEQSLIQHSLQMVAVLLEKLALDSLLEDKRLLLDSMVRERTRNGKEEKQEAQNIRKRFHQNGEAYFTFITTPGLDPTNNAAEQAIRFIVIDRYITQGTRSLEGRSTCERIWTVIATCALQGRSAYQFILDAVRSSFHEQTAPSLLPGSS